MNMARSLILVVMFVVATGATTRTATAGPVSPAGEFNISSWMSGGSFYDHYAGVSGNGPNLTPTNIGSSFNWWVQNPPPPGDGKGVDGPAMDFGNLMFSMNINARFVPTPPMVSGSEPPFMETFGSYSFSRIFLDEISGELRFSEQVRLTFEGAAGSNRFGDGYTYSFFSEVGPAIFQNIRPSVNELDFLGERSYEVNMALTGFIPSTAYTFRAVPEPATAILLGVGALTFFRRRRNPAANPIGS